MRHAVPVLLLLSGTALAAPPPARPAAEPPARSAPEAPARLAADTPAEPQRTTASFGDWTLRCLRPEGAAPSCEVTQTVFDKAQPVAQTALARGADGTRLTILVPASVTLGTAPRLQWAAETGATLGWKRCLPAGCIAEATLTDEQLRRIRGRSEPGRIAFEDGAGREAAIPFVPRGLSSALDALGKDEAH